MQKIKITKNQTLTLTKSGSCSIFVDKNLFVDIFDKGSYSKLDLVLAQGSQVKFITNFEPLTQGIYNFEVGKAAKLQIYDCLFKQSVRKIQVNLGGAGSSVNIVGVLVHNFNQNSKVIHSVFHNKPNTESNIFYKGILGNNSLLNYEAKIKILRKSKESLGREAAHFLISDETSRVIANPELEILENDVNSSHSVTITHINEMKEFYLRSRGLKKEVAERILIEAFLREALNKIELENYKNELLCQM